MTYILNTTSRPYTAIPAARITASIATSAKRILTVTVQRLISLPPAIAEAFSMIYADPYQQVRQHRDHSDAQNF
jgi:hypothetical protein